MFEQLIVLQQDSTEKNSHAFDSSLVFVIPTVHHVGRLAQGGGRTACNIQSEFLPDRENSGWQSASFF
jgi:hypothetical protein